MREHPRWPGALPGAVVLASFVGAALLALAGIGWGNDNATWFSADTPLGVTRIPPELSRAVSVAGVAVMFAGWLAAGTGIRRGRLALRTVVAAAVAGAVPFAVGPPLFSSDARTYVAIGQLVRIGGDPYAEGWAATGRTDYAGRAGGFWRSTPSPYSPVALRLFHGVAAATDGDLDRGVLVLRAVCVAALAATALLLVRTTRSAGGNPVAAVWLAVANPVVLIGAVSGAHLDAVLAPLILGAGLLALRRRALAAGVVFALAAQIKVTAVVALVAVVVVLYLRDRSARRLREAAVSTAAALVAFTGLSAAAGLGWGWIGALGVPGSANTAGTPVDAGWDLGFRLGLLHREGAQAVSGAPPGGERAALAVAALLCVALAVLSRRIGVLEVGGWCLLTVVLLGGSYWSWYLLAPLALLATAPSRPGLWWSRAGLGLLGLVSLVGAQPGGRPVAGSSWSVTDATFLLGYGIAVVLVVTGLALGRRHRPPGDPGVRRGQTAQGGPDRRTA